MQISFPILANLSPTTSHLPIQSKYTYIQQPGTPLSIFSSTTLHKPLMIQTQHRPYQESRSNNALIRSRQSPCRSTSQQKRQQQSYTQSRAQKQQQQQSGAQYLRCPLCFSMTAGRKQRRRKKQNVVYKTVSVGRSVVVIHSKRKKKKVQQWPCPKPQPAAGPTSEPREGRYLCMRVCVMTSVNLKDLATSMRRPFLKFIVARTTGGNNI